jgi:hypothetical protein
MSNAGMQGQNPEAEILTNWIPNNDEMYFFPDLGHNRTSISIKNTSFHKSFFYVEPNRKTSRPTPIR